MPKWILLYFLMFLNVSFASTIEVKTQTVDQKTTYLIHVGDYTERQEANRISEQLQKQFDLTIKIIYSKNNKQYFIEIGPLQTLSETQKVKNNIEEHFKENIETSPENGVMWNLRNANIRAVINEVSRVTGKNFIIDPRVQGKISIVSSSPMNSKELYQVFLSMLRVSGYAAVPNGDVIKIVPNIEAKTQSADLLSIMKNPPKGDDMMVQVIPVKYVPADQLVPVLRPLMPQWSTVSAYSPSNMLILSGRANNIRQMADIIKKVDSSNANGIDMVQLNHALAMDVANTLKDLMQTQSKGNQSQTLIAADDRNNAILISGNKTERIRLRLLISQLDKPGPNGANSNTQVVYLSYARAEDLVPILAGIAQASFSGNVGTTIGTVTRPVLDSTNPASAMGQNALRSVEGPAATISPSAGNPGALANTSGASNQSEGSTKPSVQIIAEPNTNSVIINAPPTLGRTLKSVISQLDIKPEQILIEAVVAEVNKSDVENLGIEWGSRLGQDGNTSLFRPGFAILNSETKLQDFEAQIFALARQRRANILSTPSVVVLDNRQAKILIGKQVSVATTSYPNNASGTAPGSPFTTFDRVNVALHLYVRPQITKNNGIQMQIDQGNDTLDPISANDPSVNPVFNISAIVTSVHVDSGDIIVLGGLIQDSLGNDDNKLPILGDIPGVGRFFRHNNHSREKKVLMVFIKPFIIKNDKDLLHITGTKYYDARQAQLDIVREQEYDADNMQTVMPPWENAPLPKPFCKTDITKGAKTPPRAHATK